MQADSGEAERGSDEPGPFGVYVTSETQELTPEQARALDATFFSSHPSAYWRSRIDGLLREPEPVNYDEGLAAEVLTLGLDPRMLNETAPSSAERETQRALDAFALRHHLAESLVRLVRAVILAGANRDVSVWALIAADRDDGAVLARAIAAVEAEGVPLLDLFLPADEAARHGEALSPELERALRMHWQWVQRAVHLLVSDGLDANAGNNKLKHGLGISPRNNLRIDFITRAPDPDGSIPVSAFADSIPVVDAHVIEFLERLPKRHSHAGSWEVTVLNLRPKELLAECLMLCTVWASVFAAAVSRRTDQAAKPDPLKVSLALGPAPRSIVRNVVGFRHGLTASTDGKPPRDLTVEAQGQLMSIVQSGPGQRARVVDG